MGRLSIYYEKVKKKGVGFTILYALHTVYYHICKPLYVAFLKKFTIIDENKILFISEPDYSGNAKALYEYTFHLNDDYKYVWLLRDDGAMPSNRDRTIFIRGWVKYHHRIKFRSLKHLATSKYIFFTHGNPMNELGKIKGQIIVNLWHGCGYKAVEKNLTMRWIEKNPFDYALVPGKLFIHTKAEFWGCEEEQILPIGYPRYDFLMEDSVDGELFIQQLRDNADKIILWMPTFRNTGEGLYPEEKLIRPFDLPLLYGMEDMIKLNNYCQKKNLILCIKRHIYQLRYSCEDRQYSNIKFISNDDLKVAKVELYTILKYSDALISDYSSVAVDYLLVDKPMAFCLDDYDEYKKARGFVFENPLEYMPGHHLYSLDDLVQFIDDVSCGKDQFKLDRNRVKAFAHNPCSNYCERIWNSVQKLEP